MFRYVTVTLLDIFSYRENKGYVVKGRPKKRYMRWADNVTFRSISMVRISPM